MRGQAPGFVCQTPGSRPRIVMGGGKKPDGRPSTAGTGGGGRGVGFARSVWGKPSRSAPCATDGEAGKQGAVARCPVDAPGLPIDLALSFSQSVSCSPMRVKTLRGHGPADRV
jgi:hypothetical protein